MTAYVVYGDRNFDTCYTAAGAVAAPSATATKDTYDIGGAKLIINTDTRACPGRQITTAVDVGTPTVSTALGGEILIDGTKAKIIPYNTGSGTPAVQSAGLAATSATWAAGVVTVTTTAVHSLTTGDYVSIGGAEPNAYNGIYQVTVTTTSIFKYELINDPGICTITNLTAIKYWHVRQPQGSTKAVTARSYATNTVTYTSTGHGLSNDTWVLLAGITPTAHNGYFKIQNVQTDTFDVVRTVDPGAITVSGTAQVTAQGFFLAFYTTLASAPNPLGMATAAAVGANGFLKVKEVKQGFIAGSTVTSQSGGVTCVAVDHDQTAWIEVVGDTTSVITVPRLGKFTCTGDWFYPLLAPQVTTGTTWSANVVTLTFAAAHGITVGSVVTVTGATVSPSINGTWTVASVPLTTTLTFALTGSGGADTVVNVLDQICTSGVASATGIQLPASQTATYHPGVWVETAVGSNTYELYPSAGSYATAGISTTAALGKVCFITAAGLLRFGHDGTQANGYNPPAGLKIRIPNIIFTNCTRGASGSGANVVNTTTITARCTFNSGGGNTGVYNIDKTTGSWYFNFIQTSSVTITNAIVAECIQMQEIPTSYTINNVGIGQSLALAFTSPIAAFNQTLCFGGGTETDFVITRATCASAATNYLMNRQDVLGITSTRQKSFVIAVKATTAVSPNTLNHVRANNMTWVQPKSYTGGFAFTTCSNVTITNIDYADIIQTSASTSVPLYAVYCTTKCDNIKVNGLTLGGNLATSAPYSGLFYTASGCTNIKFWNVGTAASPMALGSRSAYVWVSGTTTSAGNVGIQLKRIYTLNTRTGLYTVDNASSDILLESVWGDEADNATVTGLNTQIKGCRAAAVTTAQVAIYGSHWQDFVYSAGNTGKIALAMNEPTTASPSNTTVTIQQLNLPSGFNSAGVLQMPALNDEVTFETPDWLINHSGFTIAAPTYISTTALTTSALAWSASYTTITTSASHGLAAGDTVILTGSTTAAINGVFVITNIVSATQFRYYQASTPGTHAAANILQLDNLNTFYYIDTGAGYGVKRNLRYVRTGGGTTSGNALITMTDTTGVQVGDYVTSKVAGAGASTRVLSIDSGTQITVNVNSSATTAANVLYFNHLPFESAPPSTGFKLKLNIKNWAQNNTASITNIAIPTTTSATTRAYTYTLEPASMTLTGLKAGSEVRCYFGTDPATAIEIGGTESSGTSLNFLHSYAGQTGYIQIVHMDYQPIRYDPYTYSSNDLLLIQQNIERNYYNP